MYNVPFVSPLPFLRFSQLPLPEMPRKSPCVFLTSLIGLFGRRSVAPLRLLRPTRFASEAPKNVGSPKGDLRDEVPRGWHACDVYRPQTKTKLLKV